MCCFYGSLRVKSAVSTIGVVRAQGRLGRVCDIDPKRRGTVNMQNPGEQEL